MSVQPDGHIEAVQRGGQQTKLPKHFGTVRVSMKEIRLQLNCPIEIRQRAVPPLEFFLYGAAMVVG
jgi:hypothetical protein